MLKLNFFESTKSIPMLALTVALASTGFTTACDDVTTGEPEATPEGEPDGEPDVGPGDDVSSRDLAEALQDIIDNCDAYVVEAGFLEQFGSVDDLVAQLDANADNPNVAFNQEAANGCYTYLTDGSYCEALNSGQLDSPDCERIYEGILEDGETCDAAECQFGFTCRNDNGAECGTCEKLPEEGEACVGQCAFGLECDFDNNGGTCIETPPVPELGDACVNVNDCGSVTGLTCVDGVCATIELAAVGEACDGTQVVCAPIFSTTCANENDGPFTCREYPTVGESCAAVRSCRDSFCDDDTAVCIAYRAVGETCDFGECDDNSFCDNQVCVAFDDNGGEEQCTE